MNTLLVLMFVATLSAASQDNATGKKQNPLAQSFCSVTYPVNATKEMTSELLKHVQANGQNIQVTQDMLKDLVKKVDVLGKKISPPIVGKDCADVYSKGLKKDGVYRIKPDGFSSFQVFCDQTTSGGGWTVFQRRLDGSVDFYQRWSSYKYGFGNIMGEYWLGLDKINRLTRFGNSRLRIDLQDTSGNWRYAEYENFSLLGEQTKYKLSIGKYTGTAGDSLTVHNNAAFSTKDQDNDVNSGSCAVAYKGAWWYKACHSSNLNGFYYYGAHKSYADGVEWGAWKGHYYSLKRTEMKLRPMNY